MPGGRPSKYTPKMVAEICRHIAEGKTYADACKLAGISEAKFYEWKAEKVEFIEAIKRAEQQECEEVTTEYVDDPKNPGNPRIKQQKRVTKKYKPDATAIIFALTNKVPDEFKNRQTIEGKMEQEVTNKPDLSAIPDDLLAKVMESLKSSK